MQDTDDGRSRYKGEVTSTELKLEAYKLEDQKLADISFKPPSKAFLTNSLHASHPMDIIIIVIIMVIFNYLFALNCFEVSPCLGMAFTLPCTYIDSMLGFPHVVMQMQMQLGVGEW